MYLKVATSFTNTPGGRFLTDGLYSGEEFRLKVLAPSYKTCLMENKKLIIDLDGSYGYSAGFLEESFGGLIRMGFSYKDILDRIDFISKDDPELIQTIKIYILDEAKRQVSVLKGGKKL